MAAVDGAVTAPGAPGLESLVAQVREAAGTGTRLAPRGAGRWWPETAAGAAPLDAALEPRVTRLDAADLVATAGAGCSLAALDTALADHGAWLALDPPGPRERTLGGVLAAGGGGPLAASFGPPRDQVLGLTFVAGNGTVVHSGGRVVKNVAGFDLAKLVIGGHGAFGLIAQAHLRLRARPACDRTRAWPAPRHALPTIIARLFAAGAIPAACEVVSPGLADAIGLEMQWTLLVRALGLEAAVEEELAVIATATAAGRGSAVTPDVWARWREAVGGWPMIVRVGADPAAWRDAADLALATGARDVSITVPRGAVRAGFPLSDAAAVRSVRAAAARHGWPVTLERADAATRAAAGLWGAMDAGAARLARALRATLDPDDVFAVPLWGAEA